MRSTVAAIETCLDPARFVRIHRSTIVNLDLITNFEFLNSGDARILLRDGTRLPSSRSYRKRYAV